jgi:hypothetical protein
MHQIDAMASGSLQTAMRLARYFKTNAEIVGSGISSPRLSIFRPFGRGHVKNTGRPAGFATFTGNVCS